MPIKCLYYELVYGAYTQKKILVAISFYYSQKQATSFSVTHF